jgi:hypothetical protein
MPSAIGIAGTDGYTPLYQPDARWNMWSIHEIYMGQEGQNKYIPKVLDYVVEPETGTLQVVNSLDIVTFIPELRPISLSSVVSNTDMLVTETADNYRVYYDKSVTPFTLSVDALAKVYSTTANHARLYKGYFIDPAKIISRRYDNSGNYIGSDIPLSLVAYNAVENYAIKSVPICNTTEVLEDGEVVTCIIYDSSGKVLSRRTLLVEETTYVAQAFAEQKYIVNIFLKSPFIFVNMPEVVNYPVNLPLESFNPLATVQYNDGSSIDFPLNGGKFKLFGLDQFTSTIIGHKVPLVLSYRMDPDEAALASVTSDSVYVTRPYTLQVSNPNTSYNVKMYIYPIWIDEVNGYHYRAYLMNLDRSILIDITGKVALASNSPAFNPLLYGITQRLTFMVELSNASGIFNYFIHSQTVDIILRAPGNDIGATNFWEVSNQVPTNVPYYGTGLSAIRDGIVHNKVNLKNGHLTVADWLQALYRPTNPVINPMTELVPITPSHIEVRYLNQSIVNTINNYDTDYAFTGVIPLYSNIDIVFLKETASGFLKLSVASLLVR